LLFFFFFFFFLQDTALEVSFISTERGRSRYYQTQRLRSLSRPSEWKGIVTLLDSSSSLARLQGPHEAIYALLAKVRATQMRLECSGRGRVMQKRQERIGEIINPYYLPIDTHTHSGLD